MAEDHEVLTTEEAAALLRVSTKTVLSLVRSGKLPGEKVGRAWRFPKRDVLDYVRGSSEHKAGITDEQGADLRHDRARDARHKSR